MANVASAMLGITPAKREFDFVPNFETSITFTVISDAGRPIELYVEGDLAKYVELDKDELKNRGSFVASVSLPAELSVPGKNRVLIGAKEIVGEDSFLGTSLEMRAPIYIFVPYPGKYVEANLNIPNVNQGDQIPVEVYVINRGKNDLDVVDVDVSFYDYNGDFVKNVEFSEVSLDTYDERYFRKFIDSSEFGPGEYEVRAEIFYDGEKLNLNESIRVGHLFVGVNDFTKKLSKGGIRELNVEIESEWNGLLENVFADVLIKNEDMNLSFRTPSVDLEAFGGANLTGYIETSELEGDYDVEIDLIYSDKVTSVSGTLKVYSVMKVAVTYSLIAFIIAILVFMGVVWRKHKKKK